MAIPIRPKDLPPGNPLDSAAIPFDTGAVVEKATPLGVVDAAIPLASQAEAEAGLNNAKRMTPLRTAQAIDSRGYDAAIAARVQTADLASSATDKGAWLVRWIQAGAGAVARWVGDKLRDTVSVKDFGAVGDGSADDTAAIQLALDYGGQIYFPDGDYRVSSTLSITKQVTLSAGMGSAWIISTVATGNVIEITGPTPGSGAAKVVIDGLQFGTAIVRTAGAYIQVSNGVYNVTISRCRFERAYIGVRNTGVGGFGFYVQDCIFYYSVQGSILIDNSAPAVDQILQNINILGPADVSNDSQYGVKVTCAGDLTLNHVATVKSGKGLWIAPTAGVRIQLMLVNNSFFDSGTDWGVYVATNGGPVDCLKFSDCWSATSSLGGGIYLGTASSGNINQVDFINTVSANNAREGFYIGANAKNIKLIGCSAGSNLLDGCVVAAGVLRFQIIGNTFGPSGEMSGNGGTGITVQAGASDYYVISGNLVSNNTGANIVDGGTGVNKFIGNNF